MTVAEAPNPPQHMIDQRVRVTHVTPAGQSSTGAQRTTSPVVYTVPFSTTAAPWLRDALMEVNELTALAAGWDSYRARPVEASAAVGVAMFLHDHSYHDLAAPQVVPMTDGGVQLEWHRDDVDFEISFSDDDPGVYIEDLRTGDVIEEPLSAAAAYLAKYRARLAA